MLPPKTGVYTAVTKSNIKRAKLCRKKENCIEERSGSSTLAGNCTKLSKIFLLLSVFSHEEKVGIHMYTKESRKETKGCNYCKREQTLTKEEKVL